MTTPALTIDDLSLTFHSRWGDIAALRHVSLDVQPGEIVVLAGESGCGKSVLCKAVAHVLPPIAEITSGTITLAGQDITAFSDADMVPLRGCSLAMVLQNPMTTLNPALTLGTQFDEVLTKGETQTGLSAIELLQLVGIDDGAQRLSMMPAMLSGGQRQRCALAIALAQRPGLLLADEPTTALDVTVQLRILDVLLRLRREWGLSILFVTHDLGVAAHIADRIAIMYAGKIVEIGTADEIFYDPRHPYTWALLASLPSAERTGKRLAAIDGRPPDMLYPPQGDAFAPRNPYALAIDYDEEPPLFTISPTHKAATWLLDKRASKVERPAFIGKKGGALPWQR